MATFTISMSGSAVVNGSKSWTLTDADVANLSAFTIAKFSPLGGPPLTASQALAAWAQDFVNRSITDVQTYQRAQATVAPIVFT